MGVARPSLATDRDDCGQKSGVRRGGRGYWSARVLLDRLRSEIVLEIVLNGGRCGPVGDEVSQDGANPSRLFERKDDCEVVVGRSSLVIGEVLLTSAALRVA